MSVHYRGIHAFAPYADFECLSIAVLERMTCPQKPLQTITKPSTFHCAGFIGPVDQPLHVTCISLSLTMLN